jgi:hypothetical protein
MNTRKELKIGWGQRKVAVVTACENISQYKAQEPSLDVDMPLPYGAS